MQVIQLKITKKFMNWNIRKAWKRGHDPTNIARDERESMRRRERIRNFDANLAIVSNRTGMEGQECVLVDVFGEGIRRRWNGFHETIVIDKGCLHKLIDQFVRQIVPANRKNILPDCSVSLVQGRISSATDL